MINKIIVKSMIILGGLSIVFNQSYADNTNVINNAENITNKSVFIERYENEEAELERINLKDNGYVIVGYYYSDDWAEADRIYLAKYNKNGKLEWCHENIQVEGAMSRVYDFRFMQLIDGSYLMAFTGCGESYEDDAFFIKYDSSGNELWRTKFGGSGSTADDYLESLIETSDGRIYGFFWSESTDLGVENKGSADFVMIELNMDDGNLVNISSYGGNKYETLSDCILVDDGFILAGSTTSTDLGFGVNRDNTAILFKVNMDLELVWVKSQSNSVSSLYSSILRVNNKEFVVGGSYGTNAIIERYDIEGNFVWRNILDLGSKQYNFFNEEIGYMGLNKNKEIMAVGRIYAESVIGSGKESDIFIFKYDGDTGEMKSLKFFGGNKYEYLNDTVFYENGDVLIKMSSTSSDIPNIENPNNSYIDMNFIYNENKENVAEEYNSFVASGETDISNIRGVINALDEGIFKELIQEELNKITSSETLELKTASANLDIYIKSENMLSLSLDTNSVTFENYSGVADVEMLGAVNLTINSSLPYNINAYMPTEISNADGSETIPIDVLNIKEGNETDYQQFESTTDKVVLKDGCVKGNGNVHSIDLKLASNQAHKADIYKTVIKFEAEQK